MVPLARMEHAHERRLHGPKAQLAISSTPQVKLLFLNIFLKCHSKFPAQKPAGASVFIYCVPPPKAHSPFKAMVPTLVRFPCWPPNPSLSHPRVLWYLCYHGVTSALRNCCLKIVSVGDRGVFLCRMPASDPCPLRSGAGH